MNQQFANGQTYHQAYPSSQRPSPQSSRQPPNGLPQPIHPTSGQPLPPLTAPNHDWSLHMPRTQAVPSSTMTSLSDPIGQTFAPYAPTANTYFNTQMNLGSTTQPRHPVQKSRPPSLNVLSPLPPYTSAASQNRLADLAPAPPREGNPSVAFGNTSNPAKSENEPQPTHVVGSQGRRGILPSAAGRPEAVPGANPSSQKGAPTPAKDAEGKFPCPHCNKNYLHAKHLKRHLLRHTGVRPYTCGLCKDTFSRSDILKRHFQKCSQRRGNPSGESHLSHSRANRKSRAQEEAARLESSTPTMSERSQQMNSYTPTSLDGSFDITNLTLGQRQYGDNSNQISRSNSYKKSKGSTGSTSNRASLGMVTTAVYPTTYEYSSTGHITPESITSSGAATPYQYPHEARGQLSPTGPVTETNFPSNNRQHTSGNLFQALPRIFGQTPGHGQDMDWNPLAYGTPDEYGQSHYYSGTNTPLQRTKSDSDFTSLQMSDYANPAVHHGSKA